MKKAKIMKNYLTGSLLFGVLSIAATTAGATDVYLATKAVDMDLPTTTASTVPMWVYVTDTGDGTLTHCYDAADDAARLVCINGLAVPPQPIVPGPRITAAASDAAPADVLNVYLSNGLTEPTSLVIPGQKMPASGIGSASPTWNDNSMGDRTLTTQRVRSFGAEAAANGGAESYSWAALGEGTHVMHSGTHPQKQLYMGLYLAVTKDAAAMQAYGDAGTNYDNEIVLFYSEIDPTLNNSIDDGSYTTSIDYHAMWYLINGESYDPAMIPLDAGLAGERTLLRFLSAAGETHVPVLQGLYMSIIAEDGNLYNYQVGGTAIPAAHEQYSVNLPPLKTKDAILTADEGTYAIYDGNGYMTNPTDPEDFLVGDEIGGMFRFLTVASDMTDTDGDGVPDAADNCPNPITHPLNLGEDPLNADQTDSDNDGLGNICDAFPLDPLNDVDGDGIGSPPDNCPLIANDQTDTDGDSIGDACDAFPYDSLNDVDGDGIANPFDLLGGADNCPVDPNPLQENLDGDLLGDACDDDIDGDGVPNGTDACPLIPDPCPVASGPTAVDDPDYSMNEDAVLTDNVLSNDTLGSGAGPLTATVTVGPSNGSLSLVDGGDGSFTYIPRADYPDTAVSGDDMFTYEACDSDVPALCDSAVVTITVINQNDAPIADPDVFFLTTMAPQSFAAPGVLSNDDDVDLTPNAPVDLNAVLDADVGRGTLDLTLVELIPGDPTSVVWKGGFDYTPAGNDVRVGVVTSFDYRAFDGLAASNTVTAELRRKLSVKTATCELDTEPDPDECAWVVEGRESVSGNITINAWLGEAGTGTLIGSVSKGNPGGPNWGIDVQGSTIVPGPGATVTVEVVGEANALINDFPVSIQ